MSFDVQADSGFDRRSQRAASLIGAALSAETFTRLPLIGTDRSRATPPEDVLT